MTPPHPPDDPQWETFLSTLGHDLRTPLTAISGALALLRAQPAASRSERDTVLLDLAARNAERLEQLIADRLSSPPSAQKADPQVG